MSRVLWLVVAAACLGGCRGRVLTPAELAGCDSLAPVEFQASLLRVRVNTPAPISATGGSGHYRFGVQAGGSGGQVRGDRFVAGGTPATDILFVEDLVCGTRDDQALEVVPTFDAAPSRAVVPPGTSFQIVVTGLLGEPRFVFSQNQSGGTLTEGGLYTAGAAGGADLIDVTDLTSGDQEQLQLTVRPGAVFRAEPNRMAAPANSSVQLTAADATDRVVWRKLDGPGEISGAQLTFAPDAAGTTTVEAFDPFLNQTSTAVVRVVTELGRPTRAHGRLTDLANVVTADFDADGFEDIALGIPESDLGDAAGGAVVFYRGGPQGYVEEPGWRILGSLGASLGSALAVGDINEDGRPDLAVGAPGADVTVVDSGGVYLYRFDASGPVLLRRPLSGSGPARYGSALALSDVDGDGDVDLVVGAPRGDLVNVNNGRGTVDVFFLEAGALILDNPSLRLSGWDLAADGKAEYRNQSRAGGALTVGDFNNDGRNDLAVHGTLTNRLLDGVPLAQSQPGIAVFFGRASATLPWAAAPDLFIAPRDPADTTEGLIRLDFLPGDGTRPPLLALFMDRANSPDLRASGGRNAASDAGGAFLFDLSAHQPTGTPAEFPVQLGRANAFATFFGSVGGTVAGRSSAFVDVDGVAGPELVMGLPYVSAVVDSVSLRLSGRLIAFGLRNLTAGAVTNVPLLERDGTGRSDCLGAGMGVSGKELLVFASRASGAEGDFTGRLDTLRRASAPFTEWTRGELPVPARPADELFGLTLAGGNNANGVPTALIGAPGYDGPGFLEDGNDINAGRAYRFDLSSAAGGVAEEGAAGPNIRGGRELGAGVAFTDFDGDGRQDLVIGAPNLARPSTNARATDITPHYTQERAECLGTSSPVTGGLSIHLGMADGSFKPAYRLWANQTIAGCTGSCTRAGIGRAVAGGFDFNGDGRGDVLATRNNGAEVFLGRAPDDAQAAKLTMGCDPFVSATFPQATSAPEAIGDLDGDGCAEVALRYGAGATTSNVAILFGHDAGGVRCGGRTAPATLIIADRDAGLQFLGIGGAIARAGRFLDDGRQYLAISATSYPLNGVDQDVVLLYDIAALAALRPAPGATTTVGGIIDLSPVPVAFPTRVRGFGRALVGGVELTGDTNPELIVGAPDATVAGSERPTGAVFVLRGGRPASSLQPLLQVVGDVHEAGQFGSVLDLAPAGGGAPPQLLIGAPQSYRQGVRNGTAFTLPVGF